MYVYNVFSHLRAAREKQIKQLSGHSDEWTAARIYNICIW